MGKKGGTFGATEGSVGLYEMFAGLAEEVGGHPHCKKGILNVVRAMFTNGLHASSAILVGTKLIFET